MAAIFSPHTQALVWRDLWIALAEEERALGVEIPDEAIASMHAAREQIDLARIAEIERELRHDVMAHVHHFGEVAPEARGFIHLGATSAFVGDNHGLIQHRQGLAILRERLRGAIADLAEFARKEAAHPTLGYTHLQPAQPTTIGKRACLWLQDLLFDLEQIEAVSSELRFRGARGTTGTEATFLELFDGDGAKVDRLNARLAERFEFAGCYDVVGQTYPRKVDHRALAVLAGLGASTARFGHDIRILQSFSEVEEPFGTKQIGSSAMPYKRNPMRSERICALARHLCVLELDTSWTASVQWFERTLDDSANRRISLPEGYLAAEAILILVRNVGSGLVVHPAVVSRRLGRALPFMVTEQILLAGVRAGGDRQELHEAVRQHALAARERLDDGAEDNDFFERIASDPSFGLDGAALESLANPSLPRRCAYELTTRTSKAAMTQTAYEPGASAALYEIDLPLPLLRKGKVRSMYDLGDQILMVASDRISAFDCVIPNPIPHKGAVLTQISAFWFDHTADIVDNHRVANDPDAIIGHLPELAATRDVWGHRGMLVQKAEPFPVECVVRGFISGSAWKEYREKGTLAGEPLPEGLRESEEYPEPIFSPATKAVEGHDENITFDQMCDIVGTDLATRLREVSLALYAAGRDALRERGIILADTKYEFGQASDGRLILIDEVMTPDSSRFWPADEYRVGGGQPSLDKQPVRDHLQAMVDRGEWDKTPPAPALPSEVVETTSARYLEAYRRVTGHELYEAAP